MSIYIYIKKDDNYNSSGWTKQSPSDRFTLIFANASTRLSKEWRESAVAKAEVQPGRRSLFRPFGFQLIQ